MPELRKDPVVGRWVIIAAERAQRPNDFNPSVPAARSGPCAFCEGHEDATPPEILAVRPPGGPPNGRGWKARVVPNKFPALRIEGDLAKRGHGPYDAMNGIGAHEVVIEGPQHFTNLTELPVSGIRNVLWLCRERLSDLKRDTRFASAIVFKNHGAAAGATMEHSHSQIIAMPIVPLLVAEEMRGAKRHWEYHDRCLFCDIVDNERQMKERLVIDDPEFVALEPFASRFAFETWILPRRHSERFEEIPDVRLGELAQILRGTLRRIESALSQPAYNLVIHTTPFDTKEAPWYHWHIEIIPRVTKVAGFEWGSGFYINTVPPEEAARYLREVGEA
ncbi:MAG: galactose-1-phosphate uridylyltransferase [Candidatus Brocadiae bacterium]|nr:galactose-1-phosphate uridylyltransferase [Candidatus Brocadiia bacterium]